VHRGDRRPDLVRAGPVRAAEMERTRRELVEPAPLLAGFRNTSRSAFQNPKCPSSTTGCSADQPGAPTGQGRASETDLQTQVVDWRRDVAGPPAPQPGRRRARFSAQVTE
jgi:hypothetical protein